jgi:hypothetical protein
MDIFIPVDVEAHPRRHVTGCNRPFADGTKIVDSARIRKHQSLRRRQGFRVLRSARKALPEEL